MFGLKYTYARLAQLVERHIDVVDVTGSSPVSRTDENTLNRDKL